MEDTMKKLIISIIVVTFLIILAAFSKIKKDEDRLSTTPQPTITLSPEVSKGEDKTEDTAEEEEKLTIEDYFPMEADTEYVYEGEGNEYAAYHRFVDYIDTQNKKLQTRTNNGGTETVRVLQIMNGSLSVIYRMDECYYRADFMNQAAGDDTEVLLMEPLTKGTKWILTEGSKRSITGEKVPVTTPYGSFEALEVTTEGESSTTKDYYAVGIGLVKSLYQSEGLEISSELSAVNKGTALTQQFMLFYADADEKIYSVQSGLSLKTGTDIRSALEEAMKKEPPKTSHLPLISANTKLNSLTLEKDNTVHADFSSEFVTEMNAGAGYETLILQGVTNTLGNYFGTNKVLITLDGKPYESGHILMDEGEVFEVNMDQVVQ
jgi:spore germination protein GerM